MWRRCSASWDRVRLPFVRKRDENTFTLRSRRLVSGFDTFSREESLPEMRVHPRTYNLDTYTYKKRLYTTGIMEKKEY